MTGDPMRRGSPGRRSGTGSAPSRRPAGRGRNRPRAIGLRPIVAVAAAAALTLAGCSGDPAGRGTPVPLPSTAARTDGAGPGRPRALVTGLAVPWAIAFLPGGDALVTERDSARLL